MVKAHLFKMLYHSFEVHQAFRMELGKYDCNSILQALNDAAEKRQQQVSNTGDGDADCADCEAASSEVVAVTGVDKEVEDEKEDSATPASPLSPQSTGSNTTGKKKRGAINAEKKAHRRDDDEVKFRTKLGQLYDLVDRCRRAEEECDFEGAIDKKQRKEEKEGCSAAPDDAFDDMDPLF